MARGRRTKNDVTQVTQVDFFSGVMGATLALFIIVALAAKAEIDSPGGIEVATFWPAEQNTDVDLWCRAPGREWVGYNRPGQGDDFSLVYDDRGWDGHAVKRNFENMFARELLPGEYVINVHYFGNNGGGFGVSEPVQVNVVVRIQEKGSSSFRQIADKTVTLRHVMDEVTVVRFTIDKDGKVDERSINDRPMRRGSST